MRRSFSAAFARPIIKAAARHTVLSLTSEAPSLDEVFLAYYTGDDEDEERGEE